VPVLDLDAACIVVGDERLRLTPIEVRLLRSLQARAGQVVPYRTLLSEVWSARSDAQTRAIEATVARLRKKLGGAEGASGCLRTVAGRGLSWCEIVRRPPGFVGRVAAVRQVRAGLSGPGLTTVTGLPGCGRTRLLQVAAPDDALHVAGHSAAELVEDLAAVIGMRPRSWAGVLDGVRGASAVVVDLPDDVEATALADLAELLRQLSARVPVVVAAPVPTGVPGERHVVLGPLSRAESAELLGHRLRALGASVSDADQAQVVATLEGYPLEVEIVASALALLGAELLVELPRMQLAGPSSRTLSMVFGQVWQRIGDDARDVLIAATTFRGAFDLAGVAGVAGRELGDAYGGVAAAVRWAWLEPVDAGWFRLPGLVGAYLADAAPDGARTARTRWVSFCAGLERAQLRDEVRVERYVDDVVQAMSWVPPADIPAMALTLWSASTTAAVVAKARAGLERARARVSPCDRDLVLALLTLTAQRLPEPATGVEALCVELEARLQAGSEEPWVLRHGARGRSPQGAREALRRTIRAAAKAPSASRQRLVPLVAANVDPREALPLLDQLAREATEGGLHALEQRVIACRVAALLCAGRFEEAAEQVDRLVPEPTDARALDAAAACALQGDVPRALTLLGACEEAMAGRGASLESSLAVAYRAVLWHGTGRVAEARSAAAQVCLPDWMAAGQLVHLVEVDGGQHPRLHDPVLGGCVAAFAAGQPRVSPLRPSSSGLLLWWLHQQQLGFPAEGARVHGFEDALGPQVEPSS